MMNNLLLDTNILVYLNQKNTKYIEYFESNSNFNLYISIISYIEYTVGIKNQESLKILDAVKQINLDQEVAKELVKITKAEGIKIRKQNIADLIIGCTAKTYDLKLVTNNPKDFSIFKNIKIIKP